MKTKYTEHTLINEYKNLTSLIKHYNIQLNDNIEKTSILSMLPVSDSEKFVIDIMYTNVYDRSYCFNKLLELEKKLQELTSRKDFDIDYVNDVIQKEKVEVVEIVGSGYDDSHHCLDCIIM